jgi:hypothetical protein
VCYRFAAFREDIFLYQVKLCFIWDYYEFLYLYLYLLPKQCDLFASVTCFLPDRFRTTYAIVIRYSCCCSYQSSSHNLKWCTPHFISGWTASFFLPHTFTLLVPLWTAWCCLLSTGIFACRLFASVSVQTLVNALLKRGLSLFAFNVSEQYERLCI